MTAKILAFPYDLTRSATLNLPAGHLLVVWDVLANKLSGSAFMGEKLDAEERRAMWALQDICENELAAVGIKSLPQEAWDALMVSAREHVKTVPADYLE